MALSWTVNFDWTTSGTFDARNDANRMIDYKLVRGRQQFIRTDGNGLQSVSPGVLAITLDNHDGTYDPYNTSSPLYPNVRPGKYVRVKVSDGVNTYNRFCGQVDSIDMIGDVNNQRVIITAYDGLKHLQNTKISTAVIYIFTDFLGTVVYRKEAVDEILTEAKWPSIYGTSSLGDGYVPPTDSGLGYVCFWANEESAYDTMRNLVDAEAGLFCARADGSFMFRSRSTTATPGFGIDQTVMRKGISMTWPYKLERNYCKVYVYDKKQPETSAVKLWKLNDVPRIEPTGSLTIWGRYTYNGKSALGYNMVPPADTTDFKMNSKADGSGGDRTSRWDVTTTYFGEASKNVITADPVNPPAAANYCILLRNRGQPIVSDESSYQIYDYSGTAARRVLTIDNPYIQRTADASVFDTFMSQLTSSTLRFPIFQMESQPDYQFGFDLFDKLHLDIPKLGVDGDFLVGGIEEDWITDNGQAVLTTVYTEPDFDIYPYD